MLRQERNTPNRSFNENEMTRPSFCIYYLFATSFTLSAKLIDSFPLTTAKLLIMNPREKLITITSGRGVEKSSHMDGKCMRAKTEKHNNKAVFLEGSMEEEGCSLSNVLYRKTGFGEKGFTAASNLGSKIEQLQAADDHVSLAVPPHHASFSRTEFP